MILTSPYIINNTQYTKTWKDLLYNNLSQLLYDYGTTQGLIGKAFKADERGKKSDCAWEEVFFYQTLIKYFINLKDAFFKIQCPDATKIKALTDSYNLTCIRKTILCKYNRTDLYDLLLVKLNLKTDGLDNMTEGDSDVPCTPTWII